MFYRTEHWIRSSAQHRKMHPDAAARRAAQLQASSRAMSFGQDTSRLHPRADGRKAWRAEVPAGDDEKQKASEAVAAVARLGSARLGSARLGTARLGTARVSLTARVERFEVRVGTGKTQRCHHGCERNTLAVVMVTDGAGSPACRCPSERLHHRARRWSPLQTGARVVNHV